MKSFMIFVICTVFLIVANLLVIVDTYNLINDNDIFLTSIVFLIGNILVVLGLLVIVFYDYHRSNESELFASGLMLLVAMTWLFSYIFFSIDNWIGAVIIISIAISLKVLVAKELIYAFSRE